MIVFTGFGGAFRFWTVRTSFCVVASVSETVSDLIADRSKWCPTGLQCRYNLTFVAETLHVLITEFADFATILSASKSTILGALSNS